MIAVVCSRFPGNWRTAIINYDYDMVVIGSGPAGHSAAIQAAELGKRVAVVERLPDIGGVNVSTGTASKTLREAVMHLTGYRERNVYGESYSVKQDITMSDLMVKTRYVMQQQVQILLNVSRNWVRDHICSDHAINLTVNQIYGRRRRWSIGTFSTMPPAWSMWMGG